MTHIHASINAMDEKIDRKYDRKFEQAEAKFDLKFAQMEMLFKTTVADTLKQQKDNEDLMLTLLIFAVSSYSCILCILHPNGM